jgi:hypothetical protein
MTMAPRKRKVAPIPDSFNSDTKRVKTSASQPQDILIIEDSDEDDLDSMQDRFAQQPGKDATDVLELDDDNEEDPDLQDILAQIRAQEESERLAKKLQEEYDDYTVPPPSEKAASTSNGATGVATKQTRWQPPRKSDNRLVRPDESLEPFRDLFIGSRKCTNCGKQVKSPRGYVRSGSLFLSILTTAI